MKKAFSIAEAFIMLTVVSVALAAAAPMITKQIKHNNLSNVQTNLLGREINQAENKKHGIAEAIPCYDCYIQKLNYFIACSIATATATVIPTMGLLPAPMRPIIST